MKYLQLNKKLSIMKNFMKISKKNVYYNPKYNYYVIICLIKQAPEGAEHEDYVLDVKTWLNKTNPSLLSIYFTNDWNPICKQGELEYKDFTINNSKVLHFKINCDLYPKLRWYFDAKVSIINIKFSLNLILNYIIMVLRL